jgi:hypothetical protein
MRIASMSTCDSIPTDDLFQLMTPQTRASNFLELHTIRIVQHTSQLSAVATYSRRTRLFTKRYGQHAAQQAPHQKATSILA